MTGPQAISVYVVKIVPPISAAQVTIPAATTTPPTQIPTTKSGMLPLAAIGAIGLAGFVLVMRKE
jgi:hypothetical protein